MSVGDVWLINGIPGAGKTATARRLAERLPRAAHVEGDRVQEMIVAGGVMPGEDPPEEGAAQIGLCIRNQCLLARSFAGAGFVPILDYVVPVRRRLEEYRQQLTGLSLHLVILAPPASVALARDAARPEKTVAERWVHLEAELRRELDGTGLW